MTARLWPFSLFCGDSEKEWAMENKTCPYCGGELQNGFARSRANICWTADKEQRAFLLPGKETGDFELSGSDNWRGGGCPARYCPARGLILLPQKEDA